MTRPQRHQRIVELISAEEIRSQETCAHLADDGIAVTQATLSRDLREIGVTKGPEGYKPPGAASGAPRGGKGLERAVSRELVGSERGGSMVVLRTAPGHANALAIEIDRARPDEVVGTIAGDDTVFVAAKSERHARSLLERFRRMAS